MRAGEAKVRKEETLKVKFCKQICFGPSELKLLTTNIHIKAKLMKLKKYNNKKASVAGRLTLSEEI